MLLRTINPMKFSRSLMLACAGFLFVGQAGCELQTSDPSPVSVDLGPRKVYAIGSLKPAGGVISIAATPGDRVKGLAAGVKLNSRTPSGGVLGVMASYDFRLAQLEALQIKRELAAQKHQLDRATAEAQAIAADAQLASASAKLAEVKIQEKRLSYLEEAAAIAEGDFAELKRLAAVDEELVTARQLRRQANIVDGARKDFEIARETFISGVAAAETAREAALANQQAAARTLAEIEKMNPARAVDEEIRLAKQSLAQSVLLAPNKSPAAIDPTKIDLSATAPGDPGPYTVLKIFLKPGETVTQMPVMQVGDLSQLVCVAEVYEADAKNLQKGQRATLTSDAFSDAFSKGIPGTIESISRVVASPGLTPRNPLAPVDRSVVAVRVLIDPTNTAAIEEASRRIGLKVQVVFEPQEKTSDDDKPAGYAT